MKAVIDGYTWLANAWELLVGGAIFLFIAIFILACIGRVLFGVVQLAMGRNPFPPIPPDLFKNEDWRPWAAFAVILMVVFLLLPFIKH